MHARGAEPKGRQSLRLLGMATMVLAMSALAWRAMSVIAAAFAVVPYPLSIDYGEGIVLQQALAMATGTAYGDIAWPPFIVFHYPPVYHLVTLAAAWLLLPLSMDVVDAGRIVSIMATLGIATCAAILTGRTLAGRTYPLARLTGMLTAGLLVLCSMPVASSMPYARVDMLAVALTFGGLIAMTASRGERTPLLAAALFTMAVFTKQTSIAGPVAAAVLLLMTDRRGALLLIGWGMALGLLSLGAAECLTEGRFLRHIVGYNVNRFEFERLGQFAIYLSRGALPVILAFGGVIAGIRSLREAAPGSIVAPTLQGRGARAMALILVHFAITTAMLALVGKSGSSVNYAIEWSCSAAVLAGMLVGRLADAIGSGHASDPDRSRALACVAASIMVLHSLTLSRHIPFIGLSIPLGRSTARALANHLRGTQGPVISDDMVALLRSGHHVYWEPAIFAELAAVGRWDERLLTDRIRRGELAFAITEGQRGSWPFDSRYNPAVADAMDAAWPRKVSIGHLVLHFPARGGGGAPPECRTTDIMNCPNN